MSLNSLRYFRESVPRSQAGFAKEMGVPLRTYENLETGSTETRPVHLNAARFALVRIAADDPFAAKSIPNDIADLVLKAAKNIEEARAGIKPPSQK